MTHLRVDVLHDGTEVRIYILQGRDYSFGALNCAYYYLLQDQNKKDWHDFKCNVKKKIIS